MNKRSLKLTMGENSILKIDGDRRGTLISCEKGVVSVTQQNDSEDHILAGDSSFLINRKGRVLAWALSGALLEIVPPNSDRCRLMEPLRRFIAGKVK